MVTDQYQVVVGDSWLIKEKVNWSAENSFTSKEDSVSYSAQIQSQLALVFLVIITTNELIISFKMLQS